MVYFGDQNLKKTDKHIVSGVFAEEILLGGIR